MSTAPRALKSPTSPSPSPKGTQVLVRVHACGLNRADLGMTKGHAHGSAGGVGTVLGMEWAGEVAELGPDAKGVKVGDKVMGSGARRVRRIYAGRSRPAVSHPLQHEFRRRRHPARRARHHAQCGGDQRRLAARPVRADSGRELRRRPDGAADCQAQGRQTRDRLLDQRRTARAAEGIRRRSGGGFQRSRLGRPGAGRRPAAKAST